MTSGNTSDYAEKDHVSSFTFPATAPVVILQPPPAAASPPDLSTSGDDSGLSSAETSRPQTPQSPKPNTFMLMPEPPVSPAPSTSTSLPPSPSRKASTFRHVRRPSKLSPLNPAQTSHSRVSSTASVPTISENSPPPSSEPASRSTTARLTASLAQHKSPLRNSIIELPSSSTIPPPPPPKSPSRSPEPRTPPILTPARVASPASTPTRIVAKAPYRPGFQPKGVYRPRTDEFNAARRIARDGEPGAGSQKRVERAKLERRLEKLIKLHFSPTKRPELRPRTSSMFSFSSLGDLRGVLTPGRTDRDALRCK